MRDILFGAALLMVVIGTVGMVYAEEARVDPKDEAEKVMNAGIPFARKQLAEHGEFFPYAMAMTKDGKVVAVAATTGRDHTSSKEVVERLEASLRAGAGRGEYKASAVYFDALLPRPGTKERTGAVHVNLEHVAGYCADVLFLYTRLSDGSFSFGDVVTAKRTGVVFPTCK